MPTPHQLRTLKGQYQDLLEDTSALKKVAEFVCRYRFFTMGLSSLEGLMKLYRHDLYYEHIKPLISKLTKSGEKGRAKAAHIEEMVAKLIKSVDHNETWAVALWVGVYRAGFYNYRSLDQEQPIDNLKQSMLLLKRELGLEEKLSLSERKQVAQWSKQSRSNVAGRVVEEKKYLYDHMPSDFNEDYWFSNIRFPAYILLTLITLLSYGGKNLKLEFLGKDFHYLVIGIVGSVFLFVIMRGVLRVFVNAMLPSHLEPRNLPGNLASGLHGEIEEYIFERINECEEELSAKAEKKKKFTPQTSAGTSAPTPDHSSVFTSDAKETEEPEEKELKKEKKKTRSWQPALQYELPAKPKPYIWQTKNRGEIKFQPGRVTETLFSLWSASKKFDERYVVLFPKEELEKEDSKNKGIITAFWNTARVGRIVHDEKQAGYVYLTKQEKATAGFGLSQNSIFKIKTPPHSQYGAYRQAVVPCSVDESECDADGVKLLEVEMPVKTH